MTVREAGTAVASGAEALNRAFLDLPLSSIGNLVIFAFGAFVLFLVIRKFLNIIRP